MKNLRNRKKHKKEEENLRYCTLRDFFCCLKHFRRFPLSANIYRQPDKLNVSIATEF